MENQNIIVKRVAGAEGLAKDALRQVALLEQEIKDIKMTISKIHEYNETLMDRLERLEAVERAEVEQQAEFDVRIPTELGNAEVESDTPPTEASDTVKVETKTEEATREVPVATATEAEPIDAEPVIIQEKKKGRPKKKT